MGSLNDQLVKHIDEAIAMEENVKRMLEGMIQTTDDPGVIDLLEHHKVETEQHSQRLRGRLDAHGASPSIVREATGILGALAKLPLDMVRGEKAGRNARDGYATEHMEIAAYQLLERIADSSRGRRDRRGRPAEPRRRRGDGPEARRALGSLRRALPPRGRRHRLTRARSERQEMSNNTRRGQTWLV